MMPIAPPLHRLKKPAVQHEAKPDPEAPRKTYDRQATRAHHTGTKPWLWIRRQTLVRDLYTCAACASYGNEVDHIDGNSHNNDPENLQVLCKPCHARKTMRSKRDRRDPRQD